MRVFGFDTETELIQPGLLAPPLVCLSHAQRRPAGLLDHDDFPAGELQVGLLLAEEGLAWLRARLLEKDVLLVGVNSPFDFGVAVNEDPELLSLVFDAYRDGRVWCVQTQQKLIDIAQGMRKWRRKGETNPVVKRASYGLDDLVEWYFDRKLEKGDDTWRLRYALLKGIPIHRWPVEARDYAITDAIEALNIYEEQVEYTLEDGSPLPNRVEQQRAHWVLSLMSMWGIRAEESRVDYFIKHCDEEIAKMQERLKDTGIFKKDGSRIMSEIMRRVKESFERLQLDVPLTPTGRVQTDKETLQNTDDPYLHVLAESMTFVKHRGQWGPVLMAATKRPVVCRYEVLVETGRTACSGSEGQEGTNCYDGETEVLTPQGWIRFDVLPENINIAQWDNGVISFVQRTSTIKNGPSRLILLENEQTNLAVTPDHRCLIKTKKGKQYRVYTAEEFPNQQIQMHAGMYYAANPIQMSSYALTLLCATQADGFYHDKGIDFSFRKSRKVERLLAALIALGAPYTRYQDKQGQERIRICQSHVSEYIYAMLPEKKFGPWVLQLDRQHLDQFVEEVFLWDGCATRMSHYSSNHKINADWVQAAIVLSGRRANIRLYQGSKNINYQVDVSSKNYSYTTNIERSEGFADATYCVNVPSSFLVVRRRGKVIISGNCQNPPRKGEVRPAIIPRSPGYVFVSTDADTIELRAHAQNCLDLVGWSRMAEHLLEQARSKGPDLHEVLGAAIVGVDSRLMQTERKSGNKEMIDARQFAKCFHPDTEILTRRRGWLKISDLTMDDEVASVCPRNERPAPVERKRDSCGRFPPAYGDQHTRDQWRKHKVLMSLPSMDIVWVRPTRLTTRKATEGLFHFKNQSIDLRVTPDHRMLTYGSTKLFKVVEAREFGKQRGWFNAGMFQGGGVEVDERLLRLAIAAQADGNYIIKGVTQPHIRFGFSKVRKINRLRSLLNQGEFKSGVTKNGKNKPTTFFTINEELSTEIKKLLDTDKTLPWWWLELTPRLRAVVLDEAAFWDAHRGSKMNCYYYYTSLKKNAEVLQAIATITNRKTTYVQSKSYFNTEGTLGFNHVLSVKDKHDTRGENIKITKLDYDGAVYCLTVPSSFVIVRDGGIPVVCGQCPNFGFPGGLGAETFVSYAAAQLDRDDFEKWFSKDREEAVGKAKVHRDTWFETFPENRKYFEKVADMIDDDTGRGIVRQLMSDRIRGGVRFTAAANGFFQGRVADAAKEFLWRLAEECYTGRETTFDGCVTSRRSILWGSRPVMFLHDEAIVEHPEYDVHDRAMRQQQLMVESLTKWMPDIPCTSTPVVTRRWWKGAEPVFIDGKIVPSKPEKITVDGKVKTKWVPDLVAV